MLFVSSTALADWKPGDPNKWAQLPDLEPTGIDVLATYPKLLADDFLCTTTGYVTDIHIWGSWKDDILPEVVIGIGDEGEAVTVPDPNMISFTLSIHSDIPDPDGDDPEYSMPGAELWSWSSDTADFVVAVVGPYDAEEGWFNPNTGEYLPDNHTGVWQYNFVAPPDVNPDDLFHQEGTPDEPIVYWLNVTAEPITSGFEPNEPEWGWKTSLDHWNDDAVYTDIILDDDGGISGWKELRYPIGHPMETQSIDMAFVITPEPATIVLLGFGSLALLRKKRRA